MLRIVVLPLFLFLFSMACMGQTFQYSRGWTNGKRGAAATTYNNPCHKDEGLSELFEAQNVNEKRLERCLLQLQRVITNPLFSHSSASAALAKNPSAPTSQNGNGNNNMNINPYGRNHQSSELYEELGAGGGEINDTNDYGKH